MKYIIIALALMPTPSLAATCYGSEDCQRMQQEQIREAGERQNREAEERNARMEQEQRMRQMVKDEQYNSKGWSY